MALNSPVTYQLSNGLTIIAEQIPIEAVNFSIWLNIGSRIESDSINGMAHYLEHMIFKGTPRLPLGEFERRVENKGAITNAATSQDYTNYYITTAPQDFAELGPLQIDVLLNPSLQASDFQQERSVILEEIYRSADNVQRRIYQKSTEMAFKRLPYRRPVLGTSEVIEQLTEQQMRYFHATNYQPRAMTAVAVGNLPTQELIDIVADGFAAYSHQDAAPDFAGTNHCPLPEEPFRTVQRQEIVDPDLQQTRLILMWRVPGTQQLAHTYALDVAAALLSQGRTSRLVADLREERQLVTGISASNSSYALQGIFSISAQLPTANLAEVEERILAHITNLGHQPIDGAEIDRIRRQVANRHIFGNETPSARGSMYGYYQAVTGDFQTGIDYPAKIQAVEAADIQAAVCQYLNPQAYAVLTVLPSEAKKLANNV
jgi:zinc protease